MAILGIVRLLNIAAEIKYQDILCRQREPWTNRLLKLCWQEVLFQSVRWQISSCIEINSGGGDDVLN